MGAHSSDPDRPLPALARASRALTVEPNPRQAVASLMAALRADLDIERAEVVEYDSATDQLEVVASIDEFGVPDLSARVQSLSMAAPALQQVIRGELRHYSAPAPGASDDHRSASSQMIIPVVSAHECLGALRAESYPSRKRLPPAVLEPLFLYAGLAALPLFALRQKREEARLDRIRRKIYRDVLFSATSGKLHLCEADEIEAEWPSPRTPLLIHRREDIRMVREAVRRLGAAHGMAEDRIEEFGLCACEAATNALVHGNGGTAALEVHGGRLRIRIADHGGGIVTDDLPRATLLKGWSSRASMGMGFAIIKETADCVRLCTSSWGTTIIIEMDLQPGDDPLDRFHPLLMLQEDVSLV